MQDGAIRLSLDTRNTSLHAGQKRCASGHQIFSTELSHVCVPCGTSWRTTWHICAYDYQLCMLLGRLCDLSQSDIDTQ